MNLKFFFAIFGLMIGISVSGQNTEINNSIHNMIQKRTDRIYDSLVVADQLPELDKTMIYNAMLRGIDKEMLWQTVEKPNSKGALSRNKKDYFSVRFQLNMTKLSDIAVIYERTDALSQYVNRLAYSFRYQNQDGSFQLILPGDLFDDSTISPATKGDSVNAVAFFGYVLGISLNSLKNSEWYADHSETAELRNKIEQFSPQIKNTLNYLILNKSILELVDVKAPNRLLFDTIAFYGMGTAFVFIRACFLFFSNGTLPGTCNVYEHNFIPTLFLLCLFSYL